MSERRKDHVRLLTPVELRDIRHRENRQGQPYSDRDMLLDHIALAAGALQMLWDHYLLPITDEQKAQVRAALGEQP